MTIIIIFSGSEKDNNKKDKKIKKNYDFILFNFILFVRRES